MGGVVPLLLLCVTVTDRDGDGGGWSIVGFTNGGPASVGESAFLPPPEFEGQVYRFAGGVLISGLGLELNCPSTGGGGGSSRGRCC